MFLQKDEKPKKNKEFDDFNFLEKDEENEGNEAHLKPPTLYVRPKNEEIKEMVRNYLEYKKII